MGKKILAFLLVTFLLTAGFSFAQSTNDRQTEITYPTLPWTDIRPSTVKMRLVDYVKYIFGLALLIAGLIVFAMTVYGGVQYLISSGNPATLSDAKDRIFSGILGLIILLSSYLILTTINPELIVLKPSEAPRQGWVTIYAGPNCEADSDRQAIFGNVSNFRFEARSFKISGRPNDLEIIFYSQEEYKGDIQKFTSTSDPEYCFANISNIKSVSLSWRIPGIYLCTSPLDVDKICPASAQEIHITNNISMLFLGPAYQIKGVRIVNTANWVSYGDSLQSFLSAQECAASFNFQDPRYMPRVESVGNEYFCVYNTSSYGAVLHSEYEFKSGCTIITETINDLNTSYVNYNTKSVTTFVQPLPVPAPNPDEGVWLCRYEDPVKGSPEFAANCDGPFRDDSKSYSANDGWNDNIQSIEIDGSYMAVLFEASDFTGRCEVFLQNVPKLKGLHPIGQCKTGQIWFIGWGNESCVSAVRVLPIMK